MTSPFPHAMLSLLSSPASLRRKGTRMQRTCSNTSDIFRRPRPRLFPTICLLISLALWLTACGSTASPGSATPQASTPTATPSPTPAVPVISSALTTYKGHSGPVIDISWSPDSTRIASCGNDGTVQVWNAKTGKALWNTAIGRYAFAVAWSPDGQKVAGGASDGSVVILDATHGKKLATYSHQVGFIEGIAWSPDGKYVASGDQDNTVDIWNVATGKLQASYTATAAVQRVAWSPDGKRIAAAVYDGTVQVLDASTGKLQVTYKGNGAPVWSVAWSPDSKRVVSGTGSAGAAGPVTSGNTVKVWDAATGQTVLSYTAEGDQNEAYALAWSPDGKYIASGGDAKVVHVWDAASGQTLWQYQGHSDIIFDVAWSPDGSLLASSSADGTVQVWKL